MKNSEPLDLSSIMKTWRSRIKIAGKTEEQAAVGADVARGGLSNYLNGKSIPHIDKFERVENYLRGLGV